MDSKVFSDFSGGWSGNLDLAKVAANMYDARNLIVYQDGSLGPRPGLRAFNLGRTTAEKITGAVHTDNPTYPFLYVDGLHVWSAKDDNTGSATHDFGAMNAAPQNDWTQAMVVKDVDTAFVSGLAAVTARTYEIDLAGGSLVYTNQKGGMSLTPYGVRLVVALAFQTIVWSAPLNILSWPAANILNLTLTGNEIVFVSNQLDHLSIALSDGQWFVLTGVPGVNDTLRRVAATKVTPPYISMHAFVALGTAIHPSSWGNDTIFYLSPVNNFPAMFDGFKLQEFPYLSMTPEDPRASYVGSNGYVTSFKGVKALQGASPDDPMFILTNPTNRLLTRHNGAWSLNQMTVPMGVSWGSDGRGRIFGFAPTQGAANTPSYVTDWRLNRPAFTSDTFAQPGDLTDTPVDSYVIFPEQWNQTGDQDRVSEVIVDFVRWNTGVPTNGFDVTVEALARGSEQEDGSQTKHWTQAAGDSPATQAGKRDRVKMAFGEQGVGAGYRVKISSIVGVAIRQVVVNSEVVVDNSRVF